MALVALSLAVLVTCTALTVDLGRVANRRADLQSVADAVALDVVRLIDGRTAAATTADPRWAATLEASRQRNGFSLDGEATLVATVGVHDRATDEFTEVSGTGVPQAVQVEVTDRVDHAFAPGGATTSRRAVAAQTAHGGVQVASFAAGLDGPRGALLDELLTEALGASVVGAGGLAGAEVDLGALTARLGLSLAAPEEALSTSLAVATVLQAEADVLRDAGDVTRATLLDQVVASLPGSSPPVALGDLLVVGDGASAAAAEASVDALELVTAVALAANGDAALTLPGPTPAVPGATVTRTTQATVVEGRRWAFGPPGTAATTARVGITSDLQVDVLGASLTDLSVEVEVAPSSATVTDVSCGPPQVLGVEAATGTASVRVAGSAVLTEGGAEVAEVALRADVTSSPTGQRVEVVVPPDALGLPRDVPAPSVGVGATDVVVERVDVLGPSSRPVDVLVDELVATVVGPVLDQLGAQLVAPVLSLVGLAAPGAQVTPTATGCSGPYLVR